MSSLTARPSLTVTAPPLRPRPEMRSERETRTRSFSPEGGAGCERLRQPVRGMMSVRLGRACRAPGSGLQRGGPGHYGAAASDRGWRGLAALDAAPQPGR